MNKKEKPVTMKIEKNKFMTIQVALQKILGGITKTEEKEKQIHEATKKIEQYFNKSRIEKY